MKFFVFATHVNNSIASEAIYIVPRPNSQIRSISNSIAISCKDGSWLTKLPTIKMGSTAILSKDDIGWNRLLIGLEFCVYNSLQADAKPIN